MKTYKKMLKADLIVACETLHKTNEEYLSKIEELKNRLTREQETTKTLRTNLMHLREQLPENKDRPRASQITRPHKDEKPAYANSEQLEKDKEVEDSLPDHHDKFPTAKQVDEICRICANQRIFGKPPKLERITKATASTFLDYLYKMPKEYKASNHAEAVALKKEHHISWEEACKMREQLAGQVMYDRLVAKYGPLPTLTYAFKVTK